VEAVQDLVAEDPSVKGGLDSAEVHILVCPKGAPAFPQAAKGS